MIFFKINVFLAFADFWWSELSFDVSKCPVNAFLITLRAFRVHMGHLASGFLMAIAIKLFYKAFGCSNQVVVAKSAYSFNANLLQNEHKTEANSGFKILVVREFLTGIDLNF